MQTIYTVINDSSVLDAPHAVSFNKEAHAKLYVKDLWRTWLEYSELDPQTPLPEPDDYFTGEKYTFEGGYCTETAYIVHSELL